MVATFSCDVGRQGDKLLNNSEYFQITGLTKLQQMQRIVDTVDSEVTADPSRELHHHQQEAVSPRLQFKVLSQVYSLKRRLSECSRRFHNHGEGPY